MGIPRKIHTAIDLRPFLALSPEVRMKHHPDPNGAGKGIRIRLPMYPFLPTAYSAFPRMVEVRSFLALFAVSEAFVGCHVVSVFLGIAVIHTLLLPLPAFGVKV